MLMSIFIAHKRETSDALYALVRSKHKRFQMLSKSLSDNRESASAGSVERPGVVGNRTMIK